jgi:hypothetical protein
MGGFTKKKINKQLLALKKYVMCNDLAIVASNIVKLNSYEKSIDYTPINFSVFVY